MSPLKPVRPTMAPDVIVERGVGEGELEQEERQERDARVERRRSRRSRRAVQEEVLVADEAVAARRTEGEADRPEQEPAQARVDDALQQDVDRLPRPGEAASSAMKPACMKNTRNAATSTHMVLIGLIEVVGRVRRAGLGAAPACAPK